MKQYKQAIPFRQFPDPAKANNRSWQKEQSRGLKLWQAEAQNRTVGNDSGLWHSSTPGARWRESSTVGKCWVHPG